MDKIYVIGFVPPIEGIEREFNTFRLGGTWAKKLAVGDNVLIMDEKGKFVFGAATVTRIETGKLAEMCVEHAHWNHRELANPVTGAGERLLAYLRKLFGPVICTDNKLTTVIYLKRIE